MVILILMAAMTQPPPTVTCVPSPPRGPSLVRVDAKDKCPKGYEGKTEKVGKETKTAYCVNVKHDPPVVCKAVQLPPATTTQAAPAKKK